MPANCPACGATYPDGFAFCTHDGTPLAPTAAPPPPAASGGSRGVLLGVLGSLTFVLACIVAVMLFLQSSDDTQTVEGTPNSDSLVIGGPEPAPTPPDPEPRPDPDPVPEPIPEPVPSPPRQRPSSQSGPARVVTDPTGLLLRSGPGRSYGVLAKMQPGEVVSVNGCSPDASGQRWCEVSYGGIRGYAGGDYLRIGEPAQDTNSRLEQAFGAAEVINASARIDRSKLTKINVRKAPTTSAAVDLELGVGAAITIMRCLPNGWTLGGRTITGRWCFVNADLQDGRSISGWASDGALIW